MDIMESEGTKMENEKILSGKTIFITGGSVGLGFAAAKACAEAGAKVVIAARTEADLSSALKELSKISAGHESHKLDVSDLEAVRKCADWIKGKFGQIDGLVNCAGVYGPIGPLNEINLAEFERAIKINFLGTVFMCGLFAPMIKRGSGRIVNFSGGGAATPFANFSAYATSKIAIVRLSENLAEEFKPLGISVNAVAPGFVVTRLHQDTLKAGEKAGVAFVEKTKQEIDKGGVPPEKAANLTVFLLSKKSEGINGKFISAPWDDWQNHAFQELLKSKKNFTTLRRIDNKGFSEVPS